MPVHWSTFPQPLCAQKIPEFPKMFPPSRQAEVCFIIPHSVEFDSTFSYLCNFFDDFHSLCLRSSDFSRRKPVPLCSSLRAVNVRVINHGCANQTTSAMWGYGKGGYGFAMTPIPMNAPRASHTAPAMPLVCNPEPDHNADLKGNSTLTLTVTQLLP